MQGKWLIHGTKHRKDNQLQRPATACGKIVDKGQSLYQLHFMQLFSVPWCQSQWGYVKCII